jgi:hypothetical protein
VVVPEKVAANGRIRATQIALGLGDEDLLPFLCECDDVRCRKVIRLSTADYAEARASSRRCVVVDGHPHLGRAVARGAGYLIVEG